MLMTPKDPKVVPTWDPNIEQCPAEFTQAMWSRCFAAVGSSLHQFRAFRVEGSLKGVRRDAIAIRVLSGSRALDRRSACDQRLEDAAETR